MQNSFSIIPYKNSLSFNTKSHSWHKIHCRQANCINFIFPKTNFVWTIHSINIPHYSSWSFGYQIIPKLKLFLQVFSLLFSTPLPSNSKYKFIITGAFKIIEKWGYTIPMAFQNLGILNLKYPYISLFCTLSGVLASVKWNKKKTYLLSCRDNLYNVHVAISAW